ncbi:RNA polymerase factor sigma-54 [Diaphorobacter ruginosibacter]|uniref:RNA polymerase factor sigma-54 n=1 Tax=Diaphorobacter ruginosibacter TaxID=1715720 RepID=UPI003340EB8E
MKPGLSLRVSQHLALTPQLQQSIKLLQLSTLELDQEVEQMLDDNPFLERETDSAPGEEFGLDRADAPAPADDGGGEAEGSLYQLSSASGAASPGAEEDHGAAGDPDPAASLTEQVDWDGDGTVDVKPDDGEWGGDAPARNHTSSSGDDEVDAIDLARSHESLTDHLHRQALSLHLSELDSAAVRFLIESLNDDGYLEESLAELAISLAGKDAPTEALEELVHRFTVALRLLQSLDPAGVGARNLGECLELQLHGMNQDEEGDPAIIAVALEICRHSLDLLARRDVKRLTQATGASEENTRAAMNLIARLEPRPGRRFADVQRQIIVPDVIVKNVGRGAQMRFTVQLNADVMPRLRVHDVYANALRGQRGGEANAGLQQRLQEARWFIKNVQQRFDTILRVSTAIVERQKNFFVHGELAMRPLVLRDIADELGLHESTISRVTTAKYMSTPQGTFELKYFFGSGLGTETGGSASSTAVKALIKQLLGNENPKKPLSDSKIADMLAEQGIECARRTVAKYREALKIPPANLRKAV